MLISIVAVAFLQGSTLPANWSHQLDTKGLGLATPAWAIDDDTDAKYAAPGFKASTVEVFEAALRQVSKKLEISEQYRDTGIPVIALPQTGADRIDKGNSRNIHGVLLKNAALYEPMRPGILLRCELTLTNGTRFTKYFVSDGRLDLQKGENGKPRKGATIHFSHDADDLNIVDVTIITTAIAGKRTLYTGRVVWPK